MLAKLPCDPDGGTASMQDAFSGTRLELDLLQHCSTKKVGEYNPVFPHCPIGKVRILYLSRHGSS